MQEGPLARRALTRALHPVADAGCPVRCARGALHPVA